MTEPQILNGLPSIPHGAADPSIISVRDVTMRFPIAKRYRELVLHPFRPRKTSTALKNVTLEIGQGDGRTVMGPNGAGKTTLLKLIGSLLLPSEGQIVVNGFDTTHQNLAARQTVGFVMNEERSFFWRLTAIQNLEFFGALDNLCGATLRERIHELIGLLGIEDVANKPVSALSSGMKQRLAIARALIAEPKILILDEPTRALDPVGCEEITNLIFRRIYNSSHRTLLIATHRIEEAVKLCNKVLVIDKGTVKGFERIANLLENGTPLLQYYRQSVMAEHV